MFTYLKWFHVSTSLSCWYKRRKSAYCMMTVVLTVTEDTRKYQDLYWGPGMLYSNVVDKCQWCFKVWLHSRTTTDDWVISIPMFSLSKSLLVPKFDTLIYTKLISHNLLAFQTERTQSESLVKFSSKNYVAFVNSVARNWSLNSWVFSAEIRLEKWGESKLRKRKQAPLIML